MIRTKKAAVRICCHKNHIILTLLDPKSPKLDPRGVGMSLSGFNSTDLEMSQEAVDMLNKIRSRPRGTDGVAMECINKYNIWWMSKDGGIIIPVDEAAINIFEMPVYTIVSNEVDPKLNEIIK